MWGDFALSNVAYSSPKNLTELVHLLAQDRQATLWAGGTDLTVKLENKRLKVSHIINLKDIRELNFIEEAENIKIGALTTLRKLEASDLIRKEYPLLAQAAHALGSWQIRTLATLGGNLANAAPSAETATPILVLNGTMIIKGKNTERKVPAAEFFRGPGQTVLKQGEVLTAVELPKLTSDFKSIYLKHSLRRSMDIALVGVACVLRLDGDKCQEARIGLGAVAPTPIRASKTEQFLTKKTLTTSIIAEASRLAVEECRPIDDIRATASYRRELVQVLVKRALTALVKDGGSDENTDWFNG